MVVVVGREGGRKEEEAEGDEGGGSCGHVRR